MENRSLQGVQRFVVQRIIERASPQLSINDDDFLQGLKVDLSVLNTPYGKLTDD